VLVPQRGDQQLEAGVGGQPIPIISQVV